MIKQLAISGLVILLCNTWAWAVPVNYEISGTIAYADAEGVVTYEAITGSFTLSDPMITYNLYDDANPLYQIDLYEYGLTDVYLSAETFSLSGTGDFWIKSDRIDRYFNLDFSDAFTPDNEYLVTFESFLYDQQPSSIDFGSFSLRDAPSFAGNWVYGVSMTANRAESVPEPAALLLIVVGTVALVLSTKKRGYLGAI